MARKRYRSETSEDIICVHGYDDTAPMEYRTRINTLAYNGEMYQGLRHRKANRIDDDVSDLDIAKGHPNPGARFGGGEVLPIFLAHGMVPTETTPELFGKSSLSYDPEDFRVSARQLLRGQNCLIVRTTPVDPGGAGGNSEMFEEFWVNPAQKGAVCRYASFVGSQPWSRLDIFWKNTPYGWWVDHWSETSYLSGRVWRISRFRVESFEANPIVSDEDFVLPAEPGMKVTVSEPPPPGKGLEPTKGSIRTYVISPSGSWDEVAVKGFTTLDGKEVLPRGRWWWAAWSVGGLVAVGALGFYLFRRWRKKATG